jgi:hypothetical protein
MKEITIGGKQFSVRGIRLRERRTHGLDDYGYGRFIYSPPKTEQGQIDQHRAEQGMDLVLLVVLGEETVAAIDQAGGQRGLDAAWLEIIKETYGARDEEKNSSRSGSGTAAPESALPTAGPAAA